MEIIKSDILRIGVLSTLKSPTGDVGSFAEKSPYFLIIEIKKDVQEMAFINRKGEKVGGPYVEYRKIEGYKAYKDNKETEASLIEKLIEKDINMFLVERVSGTTKKQLLDKGIVTHIANGNIRDSIFNLLKKLRKDQSLRDA